MRIQCTKKLLEKLKVSVRRQPEGDPSEGSSDLFCWHANVVTQNRRKVILFVNNSTKVVVLCYRPKAADYKKIGEILEKGIRELFDALGVHQDVVEQYFEQAGEVEITATGTRSQVARMNKMAELLDWISHDFSEDRQLQTMSSVRLADDLVSEGKSFFVPRERLFDELCVMMGLPEKDWNRVRTCRSYILRVTLDLQNSDIYRVIEEPANSTFYQLHKVIQRCFGWFNCHLHMFTVYDEEAVPRQDRRYYYENKRKLVILDDEDEEAQYYWDSGEQELRGDRSIMLNEVFEERDSCVYTYDFGDDWEHVITVEERREGGDGRFRLLERHGERPPENVGGEGGFEEYLRIISNPDDPNYEEMVRWSEITRAKDESIEDINRWIGRGWV